VRGRGEEGGERGGRRVRGEEGGGEREGVGDRGKKDGRRVERKRGGGREGGRGGAKRRRDGMNKIGGEEGVWGEDKL